MSNVLLFDLETLGPSPTGIVANAAFLAADLDIDYTFDELLSLTTIVKFDAKEQLAMGRITSADWHGGKDNHLQLKPYLSPLKMMYHWKMA